MSVECASYGITKRVGYDRGNRGKRWQGTKWCRVQTRHAIYIRDGFSCLYCGKHETRDLVLLTLDHVVPLKRGGTHVTSNLVTCCFECNMRKKNLSPKEWYAKLRGWGVDAAVVMRKVQLARRRAIDRVAGMAEHERRRASARNVVPMDVEPAGYSEW